MELTQRRVYILPTRAGLLYGVTLALMLVGSINYNLSLGFGLTFLLTGTGVVSMLHTWRNLAHLQLRPGKSQPVFAGDRARFTVFVCNPGSVERWNIALRFVEHEPIHFDIPQRIENAVQVRLPAIRRGIFRPGKFRLYTMYPLGLFYAWANIELDMACLVYPAPESGLVTMPEPQAASGDGAALGSGEDDFAGLRNYHPGDSPRRIAWKAVARSDVFLTKLFTGSAGSELWLAYDDTPDVMSLEQRVSRLTRWVIDADHAGFRYGLRIPGTEIELGAGEGHRARCLEALALFRLPEVVS